MAAKAPVCILPRSFRQETAWHTRGDGSREGSGQIHVVNIFVQDKLSVTGFNLSHIRERIYPVQAGEAGRKLAAIIRVGK